MKRTLVLMFALLGLTLASPVPGPVQSSQDSFSMLFASDTQFTWWRGGHDPDCTGDCKDAKGYETNKHMIDAMNNVTSLGQWPSSPNLTEGVGSPVLTPSGVIINGDLTGFWKKTEADLFKSYYADLHPQLYPGLGNHDYSNNVNHDIDQAVDLAAHGKDVPGTTYQNIYFPDYNRGAKEAIWYMANTISGLPNVVSKDMTGYVSVENKGGFVARFKVKYDLNGKSVEKNSGSFDVLQTQSIVVPRKATDISVRIEENTGLVFQGDNGWIKVDSYDVNPSSRACYEVSGTTQDAKSKKSGCPKEWPSDSKGSLAYSFEIGKFHFVQLQFRPDYAVKLPEVRTLEEIYTFGYRGSPSFEVTDSYDWLNADLRAATAAGKYIVLNMHDTSAITDDTIVGNTGVSSRDAFAAAIAGQYVVAIFAGHIHQDYGLMWYVHNVDYNVPLFRSGSIECETFLMSEFHSRYFNLGVISSAGGNPAFVQTPTVCDTRDLGSDVNYAYNGATKSIGTFYINKPPTVTASLNTNPAQEGAALSFSATGSDPDGDPLTYQWSYGDGTTGSGQNPQHTYLDNGSYQVTVTATDPYQGAGSYTFAVTVVNVSPTITVGGPIINENDAATVSGVITDPGALDTFNLVVDWGEGSPQTFPIQAGAKSYSVSHKYLDDNPTGTSSDSYQVKLNITDKDGGTGAVSTVSQVRNVNPVVSISKILDQAGQEVTDTDVVLVGLPITVYEGYMDVGTLDTRTAIRNWGDGSAAENLGQVLGATSGPHTYASAATYRLTNTVTDDDTGVGTIFRDIHVATPATATSAAINSLSQTTSSNSTAKAAISAALSSLQGQNGGKAHNGALDKLQQGNNTAALEMLEHVAGSLEAAEKADKQLNFTKLKSLLVLTAKSVLVEAIHRAEAGSAGQRKQVAAAQIQLTQGQSLLDNHNYTGAISAFRKGLSWTQFAANSSFGDALYNVRPFDWVFQSMRLMEVPAGRHRRPSLFWPS